MPAWPPKDPDAVYDYLYTIPLDAGDSVISYDFERLSGTVEFTDSRTGADVTVELSEGVDGETSVFRVSWVTAAGREDDDIITIAVAAHEPTELVLTGYMKPSAAHLTAKYPAFVDVPVSTIRAWLTDAERYVDEGWSEGDYAAGLMALAAHNMAMGGLGADTTVITDLPAGITAMKSGSLSLNFSEAAANARAIGAYVSTRYGAEYLALLRRNRAGPRVMPTGALPAGPFRRNLLGDV